nr:integrase, catalytic region, zinc finger, CCHC-type, peptidase aspartic, catalytic [Tanacetum cinerariifolium]
QCTVIPPTSQGTHLADIDRLKKREKLLTKEVNMFKRLFRSDDRFSQMLTQLESHPKYGGGSRRGGCGDDEPGDYEGGSEDEEEENDSYGMWDVWIVDSGCTKQMIGNRRLFTSYKAYDGGHVVFGSNLKGRSLVEVNHVMMIA